MKTEYIKDKCPKCNKNTIRHKDQKDWKKGEKKKKGYYTKTQIYLYCDTCNKTWCKQRKPKEITIMKQGMYYMTIIM
jgi:hypothetical protein